MKRSNTSTESQRNAYKKYNEKRECFALMYSLTDIAEGKRLRAYINSIDTSANAYLKELVKRDLDSKGIPYVKEE